MNRKLQKEILQLFTKNKERYQISQSDIVSKINKLYFNKGKQIPYKNIIEKQIKFLFDEGALVKDEDFTSLHGGYGVYRITRWGELKVLANLHQFWYWLVYRKHNFFSLFAIVISIFSLFISLYLYLDK